MEPASSATFIAALLAIRKTAKKDASTLPGAAGD